MTTTYYLLFYGTDFFPLCELMRDAWMFTVKNLFPLLKNDNVIVSYQDKKREKNLNLHVEMVKKELYIIHVNMYMILNCRRKTVKCVRVQMYV